MSEPETQDMKARASQAAEGAPRPADRYLTPVDAWAMAFGLMVGWGAFVMPGTTFLPVAGPAGGAIALALGMIVMLVIGSCFSYLINHSSRSGGVYSYTKAAFGRDHAFLCSWFLCLSYLTIVFLNGTALFLVIRTVMGGAPQEGPVYLVGSSSISLVEVSVSVVAIAGIGLLFILARRALQKVHTVLAIVLAVGILTCTCACLPHALAQGDVQPFGIQGVSPFYAIFSLVILAPWAFVGFEAISFETAHFSFAPKRTGKVTVVAILTGGLAYIAMCVISVAAVPDGYASWGAYISALGELDGVVSVPTFNAASSIMGPVGLIAITASALASILTGIIGGYRATTRVLTAMAEDNILSERFTKPTFNILFIMVLSVAISLLGRNTLNWFIDLTAFGAIVAYGYTSAAAWKLASARGDRRYRVLGGVGAVISLVFVIVQLIPRISALEAMGSEAFLLLSLWCLLGFVFYWRTVERSPLTEYSGMSTSGTVLFALLVYCALMWAAKLLAAQPSIADMRAILPAAGAASLLIIFIGLVVMIYIQNLVRTKHEETEREKIRAVEGSLAKSQFLFNMSHDIRTPMNAIIGYTNLALKEDSPPQVHDYLEKIGSSSEHLLELINDILEMSRIESGKLELEYAPMDLKRVLDDIRDLFCEQMAQKGIRFSVHTSQIRDAYVWCDKRNFNRVLLNLIGNAFKFTPAGGTVSVTAWETAGSEAGYNTYEVRIQDTGIGMSKEFVSKMFTAFERERTSTDSGVEGSGLGLAITKSIIDSMGGTIEVLTSPGNGTEMIIRLKLRVADERDVEEASADDAEKPVAPSELDFTGKRLLLVEDNAVNKEIAEVILTQQGFEVEAVENGQEAVDAVAASEHGYYDAVLMDIQMPVMDGYTATRTIRALDDPVHASIPILAMTANAFKEDEEAAFAAGMQAHIAKPIDVNALMSALNDALGRA